jgi:hypothetical protein
LMRRTYKQVDELTEDRTMVSNAPLVAEIVFNVMKDSIDKGGLNDRNRERQREMFNTEAVQFLRRHSTPDEMRSLLPEIDGFLLKGVDTPPQIRQQLLDLIADKRDRFMPVWKAAPSDTVNVDPGYRKTLLEQALTESKPGSGAAAEARQPSAVAKIAVACKGTEFGKDDPRVPLLLELASRGEENKSRDGRVRLAAAHALILCCTDDKIRTQVMHAVADVAVNGDRAGTRMDAVELMRGLGGGFVTATEKALREVRAGEPDFHLKESHRLALLGDALVRQGRNKEAESELVAALNGFRDKESDTPIKFENIQQVKDAFGKYAGKDEAYRLREVIDAMAALGRARDAAGDSSLTYYAEQFRFNTMGYNHPAVIAGQEKLGDRAMKMAQTTKAGVTDPFFLDRAIERYSESLRGMKSSGASARDRSQVLEKLAEAVREKSMHVRPVGITTGTPTIQRGQEEDLDYAERCLYASLELKSKPGSGFKGADIAMTYMALARMDETRAILDPGYASVHHPNGEGQVKRALEVARSQSKESPVGLADVLKAASDFYKRIGDTSGKAEALSKESLSLYDSALGKGSFAGKTDTEVRKLIGDFKQSLGENHPLYAKVLVEASSHFRLSKNANFAEAEQLATVAVKIYEKTPGASEADYMRALEAQGRAMIIQGVDSYTRMTEPYGKLLPFLEKEAKGQMTPALQACYHNLCSAHYARATEAMKAGDTSRVVSEADKIAEFNRKGNGAGANALSAIATHLETMASAATKKVPADFDTLEATLVAAMHIRQSASPEGKLTEKQTAVYKTYTDFFLGSVRKGLDAKDQPGELAAPIRLYADLERQKNGGKLPDSAAIAISKILEGIDKKFDLPLYPDQIDGAGAAKLTPALEALLESRRLLYEYSRERSAREPNNQQWSDQSANFEATTAGTVEYAKHWLRNLPNTAQNAKLIEQVNKGRERAFETVGRDNSNSTRIFHDVVSSYAAQRKHAEMGQFIRKHMPGMLNESPAAAFALLNDVLNASYEPTVKAESARSAMDGLNQWLNKQTPVKRAEFLAENSSDILRAFEDHASAMEEHITTGEGKDLVPNQKSKYVDAMRTFDQQRRSLLTLLEQHAKNKTAINPSVPGIPAPTLTTNPR